MCVSASIILSEVGGVKPKVPPTGNPSPAPSTRTARTTRQINGARNRSVAKANSADFPPAFLPACPGPRGHRHVLFSGFVHISNGTFTIPGGLGEDIELLLYVRVTLICVPVTFCEESPLSLL